MYGIFGTKLKSVYKFVWADNLIQMPFFIIILIKLRDSIIDQ